MIREEFFKKWDPIFLPHGFTRSVDDSSWVYYEIDLSGPSDEEEDNDDLKISLVLGDIGISQGWCLCTGGCFIWLNIPHDQPGQALEWAKAIASIELNY